MMRSAWVFLLVCGLASSSVGQSWEVYRGENVVFTVEDLQGVLFEPSGLRLAYRAASGQIIEVTGITKILAVETQEGIKQAPTPTATMAAQTRRKNVEIPGWKRKGPGDTINKEHLGDVRTVVPRIELHSQKPAPDSDETRLVGNGNRATESFHLDKGLHRFTYEFQGRMNFFIRLLSVSGEDSDLVANEMGSGDGSKAVTVTKSGEYLCNVESDGRWSIIIKQED
jgi:hypothetical protein